jgi:hypothetical protein
VGAWCLGGFPPAAEGEPEPFPTSPSGSPWGEGEVGNGAGRPPKGVCPGRRDNRRARRAHSGRTPGVVGVAGVRALSGRCGLSFRREVPAIVLGLLVGASAPNEAGLHPSDVPSDDTDARRT